MSRNYKFHNPW